MESQKEGGGKYGGIGFKCGLEIHVQLNTEKKLFCGCPNRRSAELPIRFSRKIRPSTGELGKTDPAAMHEFLRGRTFSYALNRDTACLVETDEEPPHGINAEALEIALSVSKALDCAMPGEIIVMRKAVADGSAVSSFQRTALVGLNGKMETEIGKVRISNLSLEEDSATLTDNIHNITEFRLDRLGVPLIEIGTEPDIKTPEHARQVAEKIGMLLFENRIRGIGSIRQDLNVSIKGGARVEIKGVQELDKIEAIIENEISRQQSMIEIRSELGKRNATTAGMKDVTDLFGSTQSNMIQTALREGGNVFAGALKGFAGLMKKDCGGKTFGKELSSYANIFGLGLIHSDETEKFPFLLEDFSKLRKVFGAEENDLVFIVAGRGAEKACGAIMKRAQQAIKGVPEETRAANPDGTSSYMRPLPGSARMYPETDVPPIKITKRLLEKIKLPKSADDKLRELEKILPKQMAEQMLRSEYLGLFEKIDADIKKQAIAPEQLKEKIKLVAITLLGTMTDLNRKGKPVGNIPDGKIYDIFIKPLFVPKELLPKLLEKYAENPDDDIYEILESLGAGRLSRKDAEKIVKKIIEKNRDALEKPSAFSIIMGEVMKQLRGQIDGKIIAEIVKAGIGRRKK